MSKRSELAALAAVFLTVTAAMFVSAGRLRAQAQPRQSVHRYHYVGVQQTIARIDQASGEIEILTQRGSSRSSLLMPEAKPWEWRKVKVREARRQAPAGPVIDESDESSQIVP